MRTLSIVVALLSLPLLMAGCAGVYAAPVIPPPGMVYSNVSAPIGTEGGDVPDSMGQASSESVLGLVAWGDASVKTAAQNGGLKTVDHVDYKLYNVLGIYSKFTTVVYGEQ